MNIDDLMIKLSNLYDELKDALDSGADFEVLYSIYRDIDRVEELIRIARQE